MSIDHGRSPSEPGCQPTASAAEEASSLSGIPNAAELLESWLYLHKWVERGLFDSHTDARTALECIAFHPSAPWNNGRWDVDHKPYANKFYAVFPQASAIEAATAGDTVQLGSTEGESAVGEAETPEPLGST